MIVSHDPKNSEICERLVDLDEGVQDGAIATSRWWSGRSAPKRAPAGRAAPLSAIDDRRPAVSRPMGYPFAAVRPESGARTGRLTIKNTSTNLAPHYSRFRVTERLLLTGHSHQAWPDVGSTRSSVPGWTRRHSSTTSGTGPRQSPTRCGRMAAAAQRSEGDIALGQNTHELVVRLLSALLPARRGPPPVTTDGEFHTIRRQLDRLAEAGVDVQKVAARPGETLAERLAAASTPASTPVLVSSVLFETAEIVPDLARVAVACVRPRRGAARRRVSPSECRALRRAGAGSIASLHRRRRLQVLPAWRRQLLPAGAAGLRPAADDHRVVQRVLRARRERRPRRSAVREGRDAFAGATYDPTSHYRAAAVFQFHEKHGADTDAAAQRSAAPDGIA